MKIYSSNETDFTKNGYGFLTDSISAYVEESLNGDYVLKIIYPLNGKLNEYIKEDNIIKCNVGDNEQLFRIQRVNKDFDEIEVYATHITYDLLNNIVENTAPTNLTCQAFGEWILDHTQYATPFEFYSDINTSASARYVRKNPIQAIMGDDENSMLNKFGGEIERDNFTIKLLQSRGENRGVKLLLGKNITEIKEIVDITSMFTRIMPVGYDGLLLPEKYVDSPLINNYPTPRITKVQFEDIKYDPDSEEEGVYTDIQDAYDALRAAANQLFTLGIDKPAITIKVDWLELSKTEQYKNQYSDLEKVRLGDTLTANILGINYTTKCTKTTYNVLTDTIDKFEIGTIQKTIANSINQNQFDIEKIQPSSILDEAKQDATSLINNALGGYIYLDYETGNLYIMDTDNPETAQKVWRWNLNGLGYSSTGINGTYGIAMTMDGAIVADYITTGTLNTNVIQGYGALTLQVATNTDDIADLKLEISDIQDLTTSAKTDVAYIDSTELTDIVANTQPIAIKIHPINTNISYLYPRDNLYPSDILYPSDRKLKFTNTSTNEVFTYTLPQDLLYYDEDNYDELNADYRNDKITITKKCGYAADGSVVLLQEPIITEYVYSTTMGVDLTLTAGDYQVELPGYSEGYMLVRLMVQNAYTDQFALKVDLQNGLAATLNSATLYTNAQIEYVDGEIDDVSASVETKLGKNEYGELISMINQAADVITLAGGSKINLTTAGKLLITAGNFTLDEYGNITANNATLTNVDINNGDITLTSDSSTTNIVHVKSSNNNSNSYLSAYGHTTQFNNGTTETYASMVANENAAFSMLEYKNSSGHVDQIYFTPTQLTLTDYGSGADNNYTELYRGSISTSGNVYCNQVIPSSLESKKKNIKPFNDNAIDLINKTDIYTYNYKNETAKDKKHIGFVIGDKYNYSKEFVGYDEDRQPIGADIYSMVSVCMEAIKEQQIEINSLKEEIKKMKESDK